MDYFLRKGIEKLEKYNQQQQQRQQQTGQPQSPYVQQPPHYGQQPAHQQLYYQQPAQQAFYPSVSSGAQWLSPQQSQQQLMQQPMQQPIQYQPPRSPSMQPTQFPPPPPLPPRSAPPPTTNAARPPLPHVLSAPSAVPQPSQVPYWQLQAQSDDQALAIALNQSLQLSRPTSTGVQQYQAPPPNTTYAPPPAAQTTTLAPYVPSPAAQTTTLAPYLPSPASQSTTPTTYAPPLAAQTPPRVKPVQPQPQPVAPSILRVNRGEGTQIRKILCLDGGGVRGLASLMIVKNLMERLETKRGGKLEPWQEFDLIAGTSTGGLIAIMLGRLRMSVDQCIDAYISLSKNIFDPVHSRANIAGRAIAKFQAEGKFNSQALEDQVKHILLQNGYGEDEMMQDDDPDAPKVFVTAVQAVNTDSVVLRTYSNREAWDPVSKKAHIWQAARATSAASTFFDPITIGNVRYIDGALQDNNPVFKADEESRALWGEHSDRLIISIGTGEAPGPSFVGNAVKLVDALAKLVTSCKKDDERYQRGHRDAVENDRFFRFNVTHGLAEVGLEEWDALEQIEASTNSYLGAEAVSRSFKRCAGVMHEAGQRLGYIAGAELQTHLRVQELSATYSEYCEECHQGIHYSETMFLCSEDRCHIMICQSCHSGHESTHIKTITRFQAIPWMHTMPKGLRSSVPCQHCAKDAKARWECEGCGAAICRKCAGEETSRLDFFKEHRQSFPSHRQFQAVYPPFWTTKDHWLHDPCNCCQIETATAMHCDRCHDFFSLNDTFYWCRTCMIDFGGGQSLCYRCFEEEEVHRSTHEFGTCKIVYTGEALTDSWEDCVGRLFRCQQCTEIIPHGKFWSHRHLTLTMGIDSVISEAFHRLKFRQCNLSTWRANLKPPNDPIENWQCGYCGKTMAFEPLNGQRCASFCTQCMDSFCVECTESGRQGHRHMLLKGPIRRPPPNELGTVTCSLCATVYMLNLFSGLWCSDCKNFLCCGACYDKLRKSSGTVPPQGLKHQKILQECKVKSGYVLYINK